MDTEPNISLDQTFHYPPELLEMLTEVIPCLFKSKQGVIDFFRGAGTPTPFLAEWQAKLRTDRDSVKKHEIARDVLRQLNEGGDKSLAQRREVIKRVSEFEDFSTCYENDRYKRRTYNRYAFAAEKAAALTKWDRRVREIVKGEADKVVKLHA